MFSASPSHEHTAAVAGRFGIVLPANVPHARVLGVWQVMANEGTLFEDVLTELVRYGIAELPDFGLIEATPEGVTIALRGTAVADLGAPQSNRVLGSTVDTWIEEWVPGETRVSLHFVDAPADAHPALPLMQGVTRAAMLHWGLVEDSGAIDADSHAPALTIAVPEETRAVEMPEELTTMSTRMRSARHESIDGHTVLRTPKRVASWLLRFDTGQVVGVGGRVVIGRKPGPTAGVAPGVEQLEQLLSPQREVSANHAVLIAEEGGVRVIDLGSTNGTVVRPRDGSSVLLTGGSNHLMVPGDRVDFGDGNIAVCERAPLHNTSDGAPLGGV